MNDRKANKKRTGLPGGKVPQRNRASGKDPGGKSYSMPATKALPYHLGRRWY